LKVDLEEKWK